MVTAKRVSTKRANATRGTGLRCEALKAKVARTAPLKLQKRGCLAKIGFEW